MEKPTVDELHNRIKEHLRHFSHNDASNLLWRGYLAGLFEWGLLSLEDYDALKILPREVAEEEFQKLCLGLYTGEDFSSK
jgi:hypothetical protein